MIIPRCGVGIIIVACCGVGAIIARCGIGIVLVGRCGVGTIIVVISAEYLQKHILQIFIHN